MTPVVLRWLTLVKSSAREAFSWESLKCPGKCPSRARVTFNYLSVSVSSIYKNNENCQLFVPSSLLDKWLWLDLKLASGGKNELGGHLKFTLSKQKNPSFFPWNFSLCRPQMKRLKAKQLRNVDYHIGSYIIFKMIPWDSEQSIFFHQRMISSALGLSKSSSYWLYSP